MVISELGRFWFFSALKSETRALLFIRAKLGLKTGTPARSFPSPRIRILYLLPKALQDLQLERRYHPLLQQRNRNSFHHTLLTRSW